MRSIATNILNDAHQQFDWRNIQSYYNGALHDHSIAHPPPPPPLRQHHDNGDDDDALSIPFPVSTQSSYVYSFPDPVATALPIHSHLGVPTNQYAAYTPSDISSMFTMPMNDSILEHGDVVHTHVQPDEPEQQDLGSPESVRSFMPPHLSPSHSPADTRSLQDFPTTATLHFEPASQKQSLISTVFPPRTAEDHMLNFDAATHTFPKRAKASNQTEADPYAAAFLQDQIGDEKWRVFSARLYERRLGGTKARFRGKKAPDGPEPRGGGASAIEFLVKVEVVKEVLRVYVPLTDTCRTLVIWLVSLGLTWEVLVWPISLLQVAGFGLLVYGTFLFNNLVNPPKFLWPAVEGMPSLHPAEEVDSDETLTTPLLPEELEQELEETAELPSDLGQSGFDVVPPAITPLNIDSLVGPHDGVEAGETEAHCVDGCTLCRIFSDVVQRISTSKEEAQDGPDPVRPERERGRLSSSKPKPIKDAISALVSLEQDYMHASWYAALKDEFAKPYFCKLKQFLIAENKEHTIFPALQDIYNWSRLTPLDAVKIVIIGQDPYHNVNQAHGLAFSVLPPTKPPPSLKNIYKQIQTDIPAFRVPTHGDLTPLATRGVLFLNTTLSTLIRYLTHFLLNLTLTSCNVYGGDESKVPIIDYLGAKPGDISPVPGVQVTQRGHEVALSISSAVPDKAAWLQFLAGAELNWSHALFSSVDAVQGRSYVDNQLRRLFSPRKNQKVVLTLDAGGLVKVTLFGAACSPGAHKGQFKAVEVTYDAASRAIGVTIFEDRRDISVPLNLKFQYKPSQPYVPIFEVTDGRPQRPHQGLLLASMVRRQRGHAEARSGGIQDDAIRRHAGTHGLRYRHGLAGHYEDDLPFVHRCDLLKFVHLSNGFKIVPGSQPLRAGDVCKAEARITAVINSDAGKTVKAEGYVTVDGKPVIEVSSAFLYHGRFTDYENTFETVQEPDYLVELNNDAVVGVLQSKEWFEWDNETKPLQAGTGLIFRLKSEVTYKDKVNYRLVSVAGDVFVHDQLKRLVKVGSVEFERDDCQGNPVVAYLQRYGTPQGKPTPLANDGYMLTKSDAAMFSNEPYSKISGDFNPIHVNPYFADYAALPGTITHGMWSSAATRCYVETVVAQGHPERVHKYNVSFVGMILPGEELSVKIKHTCMQDENMVVKVETFNSRGAWHGHGPLQQLARCSRSLGRRRRALARVYGFSIVEIVKEVLALGKPSAAELLKRKGLTVAVAASVNFGRVKGSKAALSKAENEEAEQVAAMEKQVRDAEAFVHAFAKEAVDWAKSIARLTEGLKDWATAFGDVISLDVDGGSEAFDAFVNVVDRARLVEQWYLMSKNAQCDKSRIGRLFELRVDDQWGGAISFEHTEGKCET
ncbi:hypothetical protein EWM64_g3016 [Hericium alpestre]|uniref:Uracil-DNA glycosylase-like domain-containing protein n=1 Tax=Hericium alpestre TaxID=135208 RepID=A0A4Z0A3U1_9AGAM|nr:hypothetical protein EWM64_g3016 [Hericium alpestre]